MHSLNLEGILAAILSYILKVKTQVEAMLNVKDILLLCSNLILVMYNSWRNKYQ
jgi:hypothetical protein